MAKTATAVKETSMPPEMMTSSTPMAKMPMTIELRRRSKTLATVKKTGLMMPTMMQNSTIVRATSTSVLRRKERFTGGVLATTKTG